jgi:hypothetical protein
MSTTTLTPGTGKVRRDVAGGKRGDGHRRTRRVRRPDPRAIHSGTPDPSLTGIAGLVGFGQFTRTEGVDGALSTLANRCKAAPTVVYPLGVQLRTLLDAFVCGETRPFGLEALAADPLFVRLAGGVVASLDTYYDDLRRLDDRARAALGDLVADHGLRDARPPRGTRRPAELHVDIDTTVAPLFGQQEGARPGSNPRYHARPSHHPIVVRIAETDTFVGGQLRPGDTSFGEADVPYVLAQIKRVRAGVGPRVPLVVRIDAAGDMARLLRDLGEQPLTTTVTKARLTPDLHAAIAAHTTWRTIDVDAESQPVTQVATIPHVRPVWRDFGITWRVVAVRTREPGAGKQVELWEGNDYAVQAYITDRWDEPEEDVQATYQDRAGIEPLIGEAKHAWGLGQASSDDFGANHTLLLLKLLAHNLLRRYVAATAPALTRWRTPWLRRVLILQPGRVLRIGGRTQLRMRPPSALVARRE